MVSFINIFLIILLIISVINNLIMYNKCYKKNTIPNILDNLPEDINYSNFMIFYKNQNNNLINKFNNWINQFEEQNPNSILVYKNFGDIIDINEGLYYNIKKNLNCEES
jgi:hypothetical protein